MYSVIFVHQYSTYRYIHAAKREQDMKLRYKGVTMWECKKNSYLWYFLINAYLFYYYRVQYDLPFGGFN